MTMSEQKMEVEVTDHAEKRMNQYDLPDSDAFRELVAEADPDIIDNKFDSKLIVLNKRGHAAAVHEEGQTRIVATIVPPPSHGRTWVDKIKFDGTKHYENGRYERANSQAEH